MFSFLLIYVSLFMPMCGWKKERKLGRIMCCFSGKEKEKACVCVVY